MGMFLRFFRIFRKPRLIFYRESWGGGMTGRHGTLTVSENPDGTEIISREEFRMPREPPDLAVTRLPPASGCLMRIQEICDSRISWLLRYSPRIPFKILDRENRYFVLRREDGSEWSCDNRHFLPPGFLSAVQDIRDVIDRAEAGGSPSEADSTSDSPSDSPADISSHHGKESLG